MQPTKWHITTIMIKENKSEDKPYDLVIVLKKLFAVNVIKIRILC